MRTTRTMLAACGAMVLGACVTINVYFPAAAAEKAADRIIDEVWGPEGRPAEPVDDTGGSTSGRAPGAIEVAALALLERLVPAAHAQSADFDVSTPAIDRIKASMRSRHERLLPYYESGAVGLTDNGLVAVRDPKLVPLAERSRVNELVAAENRDRNALYREIARANGHPEWESEIRSTFARRWIERARRGWWYEQDGTWRKT